MAKKAVVRAWDSDALIAWIGTETPERVAQCTPVIRAAEEGHVVLLVSALALVEVVKLRHHDPISREDQAKVEGFFQRSFIETQAVTRRIAELGRQIVWDYGIAPKDSTHVATALVRRVGVLETFDNGLIRHDGLAIAGYERLEIREPYFPESDQIDLFTTIAELDQG